MNKQKLTAGHYSLKSAAQREARGSVARGMKRARRRGQALLMAVLLMVFAALLGATFITVVALNLSQTARSESKNDARVAAQAGLRYANDQITQSEAGEDWRPEQVSPPPAPRLPNGNVNPEYDRYYTPFERAQGWGRTTPYPNGYNANNPSQQDIENDWAALEAAKAAGERVFVKVPDPRQESSSKFNTPTYLLEVAPVTLGDNKDTLQIDIIGRANDNESAFFRTTTNKGTSLNGGPFAFARFDGNYDTARGKPLETEMKGRAGVGNTTNAPFNGKPFIPVEDANGIETGMTLMLQQGNLTEQRLVIGVQFNKPSNGQDSIFLSSAPPATFGAGDKVRVISTLMGGLNDIDDDGDDDGDGLPSTPNEATENQRQGATDTVNPATAKVRVGMHINGGLQVAEKAKVTLSTASSHKDNLDVAGRIVSNANAFLHEAGSSATSQEALPDSSYNGPRSALQKQVRDAASTQRNDPTQRERSVRPIAQPKIDGAFSRYRQLTKFADAPGALYGYGPGVYIDNADDVEKVRVVPPTGSPTQKIYRAVSISDLQRFWQRKSFPAFAKDPNTLNQPGDDADANMDADAALNATGGIAAANATDADRHRLAWRRLGVDNYAFPVASGSLEQRGIRGWVNPDEFLPRGVFIELRGEDIIITRDDRSDSVTPAPGVETYANIPNPNKAWKDPDGDPLNSADPGQNTFRMRLNTRTGDRFFGPEGAEVRASGTQPTFNGAIFAEGNVRVRGYLNELGRDITIVSMGNIYIEGNIRRFSNSTAPAKRVALLARKNVTLNPTQFIARVEGTQDSSVGAAFTSAPATLSNTTATVSVTDIRPFRVGDRVSVGAVVWPIVTRISGTIVNPASSTPVSGTITVAGSFTGLTVPAGAQVRAMVNPQLQGDLATNEYVRNLAVTPVPGLAATAPYNAQTALLSNTFVRDVRFDGDGTTRVAGTRPYYLSLLNAGQRVPAFSLVFNHTGTSKVDVKEDETNPPSGANGIERAEKQFRADDPSNNGNPSNYLHNLLRYRTQNDGVMPIDTLPEDDQPSRTMSDFQSYFNRIHGDGDNDIESSDKWVLGPTTGPVTLPTVPPRYLASVGIGREASGDDDPMLFTSQRLQVPWTISTSVFWRKALNNTSLNTTTPDYLLGSSRTALDADELETVNRDFYERDVAGVKTQARLRWMNRLLTPTTADMPFTGSNFVTLNPNYAGLSSAASILPNYRLGGFKIERDDFSATTSFTPGMDIEVEATIFAQDGSWFVIPMPMRAPVDIDGLPTVSSAEQALSTRYRRLNYNISIIGNIVQNISPTANVDYDGERDPDGKANGAMKTWLDSLSYPEEVDTNRRGAKWRTITYQAGPLPRDHGLYLPVTPDLMYTS